VVSFASATPDRRPRRKSMARRSGQVGYEEVKRGWFHMRFRMYVPGREKWMRSSQADLREQPLTLTDAVVEIVRAATDGYILLLRECRNCGRWFAAGLKTQVFCSPECQKKHYWSGASWKAHRRAYMRRYRKIKSLPNVK
jgi:hypothetical protein